MNALSSIPFSARPPADCETGMFEDAVSLALSIDLELAKSVAAFPPEEDEALRRKLWLAVARYVVQQGAAAGSGGKQQPTSSIKQAVEFLKEAGGLLKLEDILPFFPDFVMIDNFKDAICDSLERYNRQVGILCFYTTLILSIPLYCVPPPLTYPHSPLLTPPPTPSLFTRLRTSGER